METNLSKESINILIDHPEIIKVSKNDIEFSTNFRNKYMEKIDCGYSPKQAVRSLGISPELIGNERLIKLYSQFRKINTNRYKENNDRYKYTVYKNFEEELEFYKRYSYRLEHALKLYMLIDKSKANFKEIEKYLKK